MRKLIDIIKEAEAGVGVRFPKATHRIEYDEGEADVFVRPSVGTILKCIGAYDCRGLIYDDGTLVVWHQNDMYHSDVYENPETKRSGEFLTLMLFAPGNHHGGTVAVKGELGDDNEPIPFTDERWLSIFHSNRALSQIYGNNFPVVYDNWL